MKNNFTKFAILSCFNIKTGGSVELAGIFFCVGVTSALLCFNVQENRFFQLLRT